MHARSLLIAGRSSIQAVSVLVAAALMAGCAQSSGRVTSTTPPAVVPSPVVSAPSTAQGQTPSLTPVVSTTPSEHGPNANPLVSQKVPAKRTTAPTLAEIYAPFTPSAGHSSVITDHVELNNATIHSFRGNDDLPPLVPLSPVLASTSQLTVLPQAVRVRTAPNAKVAAWADQLGSFCNGSRGIVVQADAEGLAVIDVKTGVDIGEYPIYIASPPRSGILVISVGAK